MMNRTRRWHQLNDLPDCQRGLNRLCREFHWNYQWLSGVGHLPHVLHQVFGRVWLCLLIYPGVVGHCPFCFLRHVYSWRDGSSALKRHYSVHLYLDNHVRRIERRSLLFFHDHDPWLELLPENLRLFYKFLSNPVHFRSHQACSSGSTNQIPAMEKCCQDILVQDHIHSLWHLERFLRKNATILAEISPIYQ